MKKDVLGMALVSVLFLSTVATGAMCYAYLRKSGAVREMQKGMGQLNAQANRNRQAVQALAIDMNEYGKKNPAILPLLDRLNLRFRSATNAPAGGQL
jgi:hypothetical protein